MEWSGVEWSGVEWSGVEGSGVEWEIKLDYGPRGIDNDLISASRFSDLL